LAQPPEPMLPPADPLDPSNCPIVCEPCFGDGVTVSAAFCDSLVTQEAEIDGWSDECTMIQISAAVECRCHFPPTPVRNFTVAVRRWNACCKS
jgi:hypothetical protein